MKKKGLEMGETVRLTAAQAMTRWLAFRRDIIFVISHLCLTIKKVPIARQKLPKL